MSKKSTKKALIMSVISLLACVSMLVGSTFAWFTDSVTSAGNKIQAGTLQIDLELLDGNNWVSIKDNPQPIFNYDLWEPGYTEVKVLKIENEGSLALQWVAKFQSAIELSKLADVIDVYVLASETEIGYPADRNLAGYTKVGTVAEFVNSIEETTNGYLLPDDEAYLGIALKMQESAGNEYQGLSLGGAFDIQIFATQYTYEEDSFDKYYDEMAIVSNAADLKAAIAAGQNVILNGDIALVSDEYIAVPDGAEVILDLNGHTISSLTNKDSGNQYAFQVRGDLTVQGEGSIVIEHTGANMGWNNLTAAFSVEGGELTLNKGVSVIHKGGSDMAYAVDVNTTLGESELNVNGATLISSYIGVRIFNNNNTEKGIVNYNSGIIYGAKNGYDIWAQLMSAPAENAIVNIADGIAYTTEAKSGTMYYCDTIAISSDADSLKAALSNDDDVLFSGDIAVVPATQPDRNNYVEAYGNPVGIAQYGNVIDGNGYTLSTGENYSYVIVTHGGTIKNLSIKDGGRGIVIYAPTEDVIVDNVVIDGPGYAINTAEHNGQNLIVSNSTINGWTSLAGLASVTFNQCNLGANTTKYWQNMGYGQDYDRLIRPYGSTVFNECTMSKGYYIDLSSLGAGCTVTLNDCVVDGVVITADNYADYITVELPGGRTIADCVIFG